MMTKAASACHMMIIKNKQLKYLIWHGDIAFHEMILHHQQSTNRTYLL
jgi:hypothetical protein